MQMEVMVRTATKGTLQLIHLIMGWTQQFTLDAKKCAYMRVRESDSTSEGDNGFSYTKSGTGTWPDILFDQSNPTPES